MYSHYLSKSVMEPVFSVEHRERIAEKMGVKAAEFRSRRVEMYRKKELAQKVYENMTLRQFDKRSAENDFFFFFFEQDFNGCRIVQRLIPGSGTAEPVTWMPRLMIAGEEKGSFQFPRHRNERGKYEILCSKYGWERSELCFLFEIDKATLSRRMKRIERLWPEKLRGAVIEAKRDGCRPSSLYHEKIFDLLLDLEEEDYLDRFLRKLSSGSRKRTQSEKKRARQEIRELWHEVKNQDAENDFLFSF